LSQNTFGFSGFTPDAIQFLKDIRNNNNKPWFEANKPRYQEHLLTPFQALVNDLGGLMLTIDSHLIITPAVSKTISRIYRDTRFSKDKSLYHDSIWLTFKRPSLDWKEAPAFFFEITPEGYQYGMGFYNASKAVMDRFREKITRNPGPFLKVIAFYTTKVFALDGEKYKRIGQPDLPQPIQEWYPYKSFYLSCRREIDERLFQKELIGELSAGFVMLAPLYQYLWEIKQEVDAENQFPFQ
jgi:uncharacterized protein (TIGR02453 family)